MKILIYLSCQLSLLNYLQLNSLSAPKPAFICKKWNKYPGDITYCTHFIYSTKQRHELAEQSSAHTGNMHKRALRRWEREVSAQIHSLIDNMTEWCLGRLLTGTYWAQTNKCCYELLLQVTWFQDNVRIISTPCVSTASYYILLACMRSIGNHRFCIFTETCIKKGSSIS